MSKAREGFTLIEILVVFGISALLVGVVVSNQRDFSRGRVSNNAAQLLQADIRQAQEKSLAGVKPENTVCQGANTLQGYEVRFNANGYDTVAVCTGGEVVIETNSWPEGVTPTLLTPNTAVLFRTVGRGTNLTTDLPLNLCAFDSAETLTISTSGEVVIEAAACATPYVAPATPSSDPTAPPTLAPSPTPSWTFCANEGSTCSLSSIRFVRYGAGTSYNSLAAAANISCNNSTFGDPIPGTSKKCEIMDSFVFCANEGGVCTFSGTRMVVYGANNSYSYKAATGSINCNNSTFGDPIPGTSKKCYYYNP